MNDNGVGTSSVIARHDYLPFGEELGANVGMRTGAQGYNVPDANRQKYAMLERDSTGLDHTWWRKYESTAADGPVLIRCLGVLAIRKALTTTRTRETIR